MYNVNLIEERFNRLENLILLQKKKLTLKEVAMYTGYKESYIYKLTASHRIPHSKPEGGAIFFDREELDEWLSRNPSQIENNTNNANTFKCKTCFSVGLNSKRKRLIKEALYHLSNLYRNKLLLIDNNNENNIIHLTEIEQFLNEF